MKVRLYGNCQVTMLECLFKELGNDWDILSREVHTFDVHSNEAFKIYESEVEEADVIIAQPISENYRGVNFFSRKWISAAKRKEARLITFPSIYFRGYTIQSFDLTTEPHVTEYHDVHIADMYAKGVPLSQCVEKICSTNYFTKEFVDHEMKICLDQLAQREISANVDVKVTPLISNFLGQGIVFHTFNHPARVIMVDVANKLLKEAGETATVAVEGIDHLSNTRIMPYLSAALHMGLPASALTELDQIVLLHQAETLNAFAQASYESYDRYGRDKVRSFIENNAEASAYLKRFQSQSCLRHQDFDYGPFVQSLYKNLLKRSYSASEIYYWITIFREAGPVEAFRIFSDTAEFKQLHAHREG